MKIRHEVCMDCDSTKAKQYAQDVLADLSHDPLTFNLKPSTNVDAVHGSVSIAFCDTRTLGENIQWHDGKYRILTVDNIAGYFAGQGHTIKLIVGDKYYGNTIIDVEIYETNDGRRQKPRVVPTAQTCATRIDNGLSSRGLKLA